MCNCVRPRLLSGQNRHHDSGIPIAFCLFHGNFIVQGNYPFLPPNALNQRSNSEFQMAASNFVVYRFYNQLDPLTSPPLASSSLQINYTYMRMQIAKCRTADRLSCRLANYSVWLKLAKHRFLISLFAEYIYSARIGQFDNIYHQLRV